MTLKKLALTAQTLVLPSIGLLAKNTDTAEIRDTRITIKTGTSETGAAVAPSLPLGKYSTTWPSGFKGGHDYRSIQRGLGRAVSTTNIADT
jgi:hypothetical protein